MIFRLFRIEAFKTRGSLALLMTVLCPLLVVLLNTGMLLKGKNLESGNPKVWFGFWMGSLAVWCYFMLPLYIALMTALVNGNEHRNHTWRLMLTLPITHRQLFLSKLMLVTALLVGANVALMVFCFAVNGAFSLFGYALQTALDFPVAQFVFKASIASLPVLVIQHVISWRFSNIVLPLGIGVGATMGILQFGNSEYWQYFPWAYALMAANGSDVQMQRSALELAVLVGLPLLVLSTYWLGKREITA